MVNKNKHKFNPNYTVPPGDTLLEAIEALGISQTQLAERTGKTTKTINEIIKGKAAITPQTALQLERVLNIPASFWNSRQIKYDEKIAELNERKQLETQLEWLSAVPLKEMIKNKWIEKKNDEVSQLREVLNFFGLANIASWKDVWRKVLLDPKFAFRKPEALETEPISISAWLRKGELEAQSLHCEPYDARLFKHNLGVLKPLTMTSPDKFIPQLISLCSEAGVAVVFVNEIGKSRVNGAARWLTSDKALIQLSLRYKTDDHLWFTFFHEAGHILLHGKKDFFLEYDDNETSNLSEHIEKQEKEANQFSSDFLIPFPKYNSFIKYRDFSEHSIIKFAKENNISSGIVVGRLQFDGLLTYRTRLNSLKTSLKWDEYNWSNN